MRRVFVVDDEALARRRLIRMLEATGRVEVTGDSGDPEAAVAAIAATPDLDLVFVDIAMPVLDGFALCAQLPPGPMIVFTTAHDEDSRLDVRSELLVASLILADRRFELSFEAYGARRLGPDLTVTFRANQRFNLEVTRLRTTGDAGDDKLANVISGKLRQLPSRQASRRNSWAEGQLHRQTGLRDNSPERIEKGHVVDKRRR